MACTNQNTSFVVGLTGSIASGKSTCAQYFQSLGATVHDADAVAKTLLQPDTIGWQACLKYFGPSIQLPDGTLDRKQLRQRIFQHPEAKQWLETLLHPEIRKNLDLACQKPTATYHILMVPLLFQSDHPYPLHRTCVVIADPLQQIERVMRRDQTTRTMAQSILSQQWSNDRLTAQADDVIHNLSDLNTLQQQVATKHQHYMKMASRAQTK